MTLQDQIDEKRREIFTDGYPMSVGEIVNLYRDGDLDTHPEFQRYFRWSPAQKSRFIESLLLGIPIPSIFVYQRQDGVWDVVDGVQRLSTILEFMGELKDRNGYTLPACQLVKTSYLPDLHGVHWSEEIGEPFLTAAQQRLIKRSSLDVKIVTRESDDAAKFDLFQRLNTGGSLLSNQEVLNSLLVMTNNNFYQWLRRLTENHNFQTTVTLTTRQIDEQYDVELVLRFFALNGLDDAELPKIGDLSDFLASWALNAAKEWDERKYQESQATFEKCFSTLNEALGEGAFRKFNPTRGIHVGAFSVAAFEAVTAGTVTAIRERSNTTEVPLDFIRSKVQEMWERPGFRDNSGMGVRANTRIAKVIPFAREYFTNEG